MPDSAAKLVRPTCTLTQNFGWNSNTAYAALGLKGHPGTDVGCGYGADIAAIFNGYVYSSYTTDHPAQDGYTAVFTIVETPLEVFEMSYGHVSAQLVSVGETVTAGQIIAKEGNRGTVFYGGEQITLAMQAAGDTRGAHCHYQKRALLKVKHTNGLLLSNAQGVYIDQEGYYYQVYDEYNGYRGCVDVLAPLFPRNLFIGLTGYDVLLLQRALSRDGFLDSQYQTSFFGARTFAAVRAFQKANSLPSTGFVGVLTRGVLNTRYPAI